MKPVPTIDQRRQLAADFAARHPRTARSQQHAASIEAEWRAAPRPLPVLQPAPPSLFARFNAAVDRAHDGMPLVWAAAVVLVLVMDAHYMRLLARAWLGGTP